MTTKALILQQLLEVVGHADQVELDVSVAHVDACWMHISEYLSLLVHVVYALCKLPENRDNLVQRELSFAKRLPRRDVVRTFAAHLQEATGHVTVKIPDRSRQV